MSLISRMRKQKAAYFARTTPNRFGEYSYLPGVLIDCRWDDVQEEFIDPEGHRRMSRAVVYVDREMTVGDLLLQVNVLPSWNGNVSPLGQPGVFRIAQAAATPNLRNTETLRTMHLG